MSAAMDGRWGRRGPMLWEGKKIHIWQHQRVKLKVGRPFIYKGC